MLGTGVFGAGVLGAQQSQNAVAGVVIVLPSDGATLGTGFVVSGTTDSAGDVEYQVDAGGWLTLATPSAGDFSGTVSGLSIGAHTLDVRQSDNTSVTDSISITVVADTITITSPSQFKLYRRGASSTTDVMLTVEYNGLPTNVEARFNRTGAESWRSFPRTGSPQDITLPSEARGYGTLEVRYSNATSVTDSVDDVAVGRTIAVWGQSNGSGRGTNNQTAPAAGAYLYDATGVLRAMSDPTDGNFGGSADYPVLDDGVSAAGSWLPRLAVRMLAQGEPVLMLNCCKGSTTIGSWSRSLLTTSLYGAAKARCDAAGGVDYIIWHQGEANALAAQSEAAHETALTQLVSDIRSDLANPTVVINLIHHWTGVTSTDVDAIRAAQNTVGTTVTGAVLGGDMDGITTALHLTTDTDLTTAGDLIFEAAFIGDTPDVDSAVVGVGGSSVSSIQLDGVGHSSVSRSTS